MLNFIEIFSMKLYMEVNNLSLNFLNDTMDSFYSLLTGKNIIGVFVSLCLVLYGGLAGPKLPKIFKDLFENTYFKFLILSLVAYSSVKDYKVSLLLAFAFTFSISMFDNRYIKEAFEELKKQEIERFSAETETEEKNCPEGKVESKGECLDKCPEGETVYDDNNICKKKCRDDQTLNESNDCVCNESNGYILVDDQGTCQCINPLGCE